MRNVHTPRKLRRNAYLAGAIILSFVAMTGCRSAYVEATVHNATGGPVTLLEVDYPSASFGSESLPNGASFHYRFKVLGSGATKVSWTDAGKQEHAVSGPELHEGEEGHVDVTLTQQSATWELHVHPGQ